MRGLDPRYRFGIDCQVKPGNDEVKKQKRRPGLGGV
jgi:hypothetical protein